MPYPITSHEIAHWQAISSKVFFLDYDGTLIDYADVPIQAGPDEELLEILQRLTSYKNNQIVLITGRNMHIMDTWFGHLPSLYIIAEHGVWQKRSGKSWEIYHEFDTSWKTDIKPIIQSYVDHTSGSHMEEKHNTLVWHYRNADENIGNQNAINLIKELAPLVQGKQLDILSGKKVVEIKSSTINKGIAAQHFLNSIDVKATPIMIGDDTTDEDMFRLVAMPAISIKVGSGPTYAAYHVESSKKVRQLIQKIGTPP